MKIQFIRMYTLTPEETARYMMLWDAKQTADKEASLRWSEFSDYWAALAPKVGPEEDVDHRQLLRAPNGQIIIITVSNPKLR